MKGPATKAGMSRIEAAMDRVVRDVTRNFALMMVAFVIAVILVV